MKNYKRALLAIVTTLSMAVSGAASPASAAISLGATVNYTAQIEGSNIWSGNLPTQIRFTGTYSSKLEFPITGILPYSQLADRATGVEVEFELWSNAGKKIGDDTIYSSQWNPVGPDTIVSMYVSADDAVGSATLLARTMWTVRTNGLLSRYLQTETLVPVTFVTGSVPATIKNLKNSWKGKTTNFTFSAPKSSKPIDYYEATISYMTDNSSNPKYYANYTPEFVVKTLSSRKFSLKKSEVQAAIERDGAGSPKYIMVRVRAHSELGYGEYSNGIYFKVSVFK
jgi:hypothetical protein